MNNPFPPAVQQGRDLMNATVEHLKTKKKVLSHENFRTKERNIVAVKAKMNQPQFIYNRTYVNMQPGKCVEYNLNDDTSLLTRDERFQDFMDRPYAVIPTTANHKGDQRAYLLISPNNNALERDRKSVV